MPRPVRAAAAGVKQETRQEELYPGVLGGGCSSLDRHICGGHLVAAGGAIGYRQMDSGVNHRPHN